MLNNMLNNAEVIRVNESVSAGQTNVESDAVDMAGWRGAMFVVALGDVTSGATVTVAAQHSEDGQSGWETLEGAVSFEAGGDDGDKLVALDVVAPENRYVRVLVTRADENVQVDSIVATRYGALHNPPESGDTVAAQGTAANPAAA